jgi:hypothetical protein
MDHAVGAAKYATMATGVLWNSSPKPTPSSRLRIWNTTA